MAYKTVSPDGPDWLPKAVVCKVWDTPDKYDICTRTIIGFSVTGWYIDTGTRLWRHAEPVEAWETQKGERVIAWDGISAFAPTVLTIGHYLSTGPNGFAIREYGFCQHIGRLKNSDGTMVDLDCTIEELKQRTDWK